MVERPDSEPMEDEGPPPIPVELLAILRKEDIPVHTRELNALKHIVVPHSHFVEGMGRLTRILRSNVRNPMAEGGFLLLRGLSRSGKTHMLKSFALKFPARKGKNGWVRSVVYVEAPPTGGPTALLRAILESLEVQVSSRRDGDELNSDVQRHLNEQRVNLLILDEFQHVVDHKTHKYAYKAADVLKRLLNKNTCHFVFAGLPNSREVLAVNSQLHGRMLSDFEMRRYDWLSEPEQADYLDYLAELADQTIELGLFSTRPPLDGHDLGQRINYAASGLVGLTSRLVCGAADLALRTEAATITVDHLRKVFEELKRIGVTANPFVGACPQPNPDDFEILLTLGSDEPTNLSKRKKRAPRASFSK